MKKHKNFHDRYVLAICVVYIDDRSGGRGIYCNRVLDKKKDDFKKCSYLSVHTLQKVLIVPHTHTHTPHIGIHTGRRTHYHFSFSGAVHTRILKA